MQAKCLTADWQVPKSIHTMLTTRIGGCSIANYSSFNLATHVNDNPHHVRHNRELLQQSLPSMPYWLNQTHSNAVVNLDDVQVTAQQIASSNISPLNYDAAFTHEKNKICVVLTADCVPILLTDIHASFVAAIHAGWRGLENGVISNCIKLLNAKDVIAYVGPAICAKHYQVNQDVFNAFMALSKENQVHFQQVQSDNKQSAYQCDLIGIAKQQLINLDVARSRIFLSQKCTICDKQLFYSHRQQNPTGRFASLIWLT